MTAQQKRTPGPLRVDQMTMSRKDWAALNPPGGILTIIRDGLRVVAAIWGDDDDEEQAIAARFIRIENAEAKIREALEFYANSWRGNAEGDFSTPGLSHSWMEPTDKLFDDEGAKARAALALLDGEGNARS